MQVKFLILTTIFLVTIYNCLAQKGGSYGQNLLNQNRSPARQLQTARASFLSSGPTSAVVSQQPIVQQLQTPQVQQYEEDQQSAIAAPLRDRPSTTLSGSTISDPSSNEEEGHPAPEPYSFSYAVNDEENGSEISREESQDAAGNIVGFYHIRDKEGRMRRVDYTAGPEGFRATIHSNEEGLANKDSADAKYEVDEVPAERQEQAAAAARARAQAVGPSSGSYSSKPSSFNSGSFGSDRSSYALAAGERHKTVKEDVPSFNSVYSGGSKQQVQQQEDVQKEVDHLLVPSQTLVRSKPQSPVKRPSTSTVSGQSKLPGVTIPSPVQQRTSLSNVKRLPPPPSESYLSSQLSSPSKSTVTPSLHISQQPQEQQIFDQQQNEEAEINLNIRPTSSFPSAFPSSRFRSNLGQQQVIEQQQQEYEDQQQEEFLQQKQTVKSKRWALPLNFFLPQAFRS